MSRKLLNVVAAIMLTAVCIARPESVSAAPPTDAAMHLEFEQGEAELRRIGVELDRPEASDAIEVDCSIARRGSRSQRARVRQSAKYVSFGAHRAEASAGKLKALNYKSGGVWDYGFSLRVEGNAESKHDDKVSILWQFKRTSSPPDGFVGLKSGKLYLRVGERAQTMLMDPMPVDTWLDVELRVIWSTGPDGRIE